jgi:hypothetical protein
MDSRWIHSSSLEESFDPQAKATTKARWDPGIGCETGSRKCLGYTRILGELRKLGNSSISRQTVKNNLKKHNLDPGRLRGKGTSWHLACGQATCHASHIMSARNWDLLEIRLTAREHGICTGQSINTVKLYEITILPVVSENVSAAIASYTAATVVFLRLVQA